MKQRQFRRRPGKACARGGFTLIEVMIGSGILVFAALALSRATVQSMKLSQQNRETALAQAAARQAMEDLQARPFDEIFTLFNSDPDDNPSGVPEPGTGFDVPGLSPRAGDPDQMVGQVILPEIMNGGASELREDFEDGALGMPMDLDGNGFVDEDLSVADTYQVLPVRIRLEWTGKGGDRVFEVRTVVSSR